MSVDVSSSKEDLEAELIELYDTLDGKDKRISELEEAVANAKDKVKAAKAKAKAGRSSSKLEAKLKTCQKELDDYKEAFTDLEAELRQLQIDHKLLAEQKADLEAKVETQKAKISTQKERTMAARRQSEEAKQLQKDQSNDQYRLEVENKQLRDTIKELEENEEDLVAEVEILANEKYELELKCRSVADDKDRLREEFDLHIKSQADNEDERIELQQELQSALDMNMQLQEETTASREACAREISSLRAALDKARRENAAIEENAAISYGAQKQKALQNEIGNLRQEVRRVREELKHCAEDKEQAEQDLESTCKALVDAGRECEDRIQNAIVKERKHAQELEARLEAAARKESDMDAAQADLKRQKDEAVAQLNRSEERNSWYEEGHGLADAVRYQKKLEAELYRRDHDLKQLRDRVNVEVGKCQVLQETCILLKEKANLMDDPMFEEEAVKEAMASHDNQLESQNVELSRQIERLEVQRLSMLKQLRHNAAEIGEKGIKFLGLDALEIQKVMEFASNLRDGAVALPLDDRSRELQDELLTIKAERETDKVTIERLERDIIGLRGCDADQVKAAAEVQELKQSLSYAQDQNKALEDEVKIVREDAAKALSAQRAVTEDVLPPAIRERAQKIIGEPLVEMPSGAQVQVLCLVKEYDAVSEGLSRIQESMVQADKDESSANNILRMQILEQKMSIFNISSDSPLYKDVKAMAAQLTDCLELLAAREKDVTSKDDLLQQYESEIKTMREQVSALYKDHIQQQVSAAEQARAKSPRKSPKEELKEEPEQPTLEKDTEQQQQQQQQQQPPAGKEKSAQTQPQQQSQPQTEMKQAPSPCSTTEDDAKQLKLLQKELKSVREAAQARMAQLKALLDEKNATIEQYRQKLMRSDQSLPSDKQQNESQSFDESETTVAKLRRAVKNVDLDSDSEAGSEARIGLVKQVDSLAALVRDKEARIHRLETKLRSSEEGRITSEKRCSDALQEMDRIKGDMQSLAHLIQDSEGRMAEISAAKRQISMLQIQLDEKEDKLHRMSLQLSRWKAKGGNNVDQQPPVDEAKLSQLSAEVAKVKRQLTATRLAKRKCEEEVEQYKKQSAHATEDVARMEKEVTKLKQVAIDARMDKENASSKAARAVTKLKEIQNVEEANKRELERVQELENKVASLLRKNAHLRGQLASAKQGGDEGQDGDAKKADLTRTRSATTTNSGDSSKDQAKLRTLEKRLNERRAECKKLRDDLDLVRKTHQKERSLVNDLQSSLKALEGENTRLKEELTNIKKVKGGVVGSSADADPDAVSSKQDVRLENELKRLQDEVADLKRNQNQATSDSQAAITKGGASSSFESSHQRLKDDLSRVEKENQGLSDKLREVSLAEQRLQSRIVNLESEKAMLQRELHAFDLDFFEEIETLKYNYSEAVRKLKEHNASSSNDDGGGMRSWSSIIYET